jgi:16S rRNA (guanine966-N2)-methyltransferase
VSNPRIIAGKARGIRLKDVPGDITRPVTDIVKGAAFNVIGGDVYDSNWLDLFGGTGSIGIEALSRGAKFVRFVDLNWPAVKTIRANLETTHLAEFAEVLQSDAFSVLARPADRQFDYIYIAPPQYKGMWQRAMQALDANPAWLAEDAWVLVQIDPIEYETLALTKLVTFDERKYGNTLLVFYQLKAK